MTLSTHTTHRPARRSLSPSHSPFRIAFVGCGPKGLYGLERLAYQLARTTQQTDVQITIYEPAPFPGAGSVYDPRQPHFLRMNFSAVNINAWPEMVRQDSPQSYPTFVEWLDRQYPTLATPHCFAPRALVGEYLSEAFEQTCERFPDFVTLHQNPAKVMGIRKTASGWHLKTAKEETVFDEVLLAVGHERWKAAPVPNVPAAKVIEQVFPTERMLSLEQVPPRSTVAVRGFALTFIDACLALTEGRGGRFEQHNHRWKYLPSGNEVLEVLPYSRTGHPILAKPDPRHFPACSELNEIWEQGRLRLLKLKQPRSGLHFRDSLWPVILKTAGEALLAQVPDHSIGQGTPIYELDCWFKNWCSRVFTPSDAHEQIKQSWRVATGQTTADEAWALGETFRQLYPALVRRISHGGLAVTSWPDFQLYATEMERLAFGPPAENTGRLLALIDAGIVNLDYLQSDLINGQDQLVLQTGKKQQRVDRLINAVLPAGTHFAQDSLIEQLLSSGWIKRMLGAGGIAIDDAARPIPPEEQTTEGLAIIGRATEGAVLGNDTLSRQLHSCPDLWARSVCDRISQRNAL
ncbi:hypothetical protein V6x_36280 [Gimesia chilikensis]|uniref:FAD-dependent urate hydroxylase HpyO/Asp monooxygenase CreE-like FAD/NAD(P)-binding domain-containing protein n=1 Tax=Gimesia chilikensis TaxID=2605989 RepID=A0A517WF69_9PLAN|nr:FAD/NAD(P)-binding domain-containing protein [Gimesia chilikensis]QDU03905.1 hypothetical protein V6x_36280 [Gimesia chilikensis]